jgi:hypothetical protein
MGGRIERHQRVRIRLVKGATLADRIAHGPVPLDEALPPSPLFHRLTKDTWSLVAFISSKHTSGIVQFVAARAGAIDPKLISGTNLLRLFSMTEAIAARR